MIICSPQLGLNPESNSGGEVYDREVINHLCNRGVKALTFLPKNKPYLKVKNLTVQFAAVKPMFPPHIFNFFVLNYLVKTYRQIKFDILRVHNPYFVGPAAAIFKKLYPQVPIVASYLHLESGFNHLIDKAIIKHFDHIITISKSTQKEIIDTLNYPCEKISVAYPGVDERFKPGQKTSKQFTVMFVGGLKPRKNPEFLLKVMQQINRPKVQLIFAGAGPLKSRLKGKNIRVTGFIPEAQKSSFYHQADVVVLPSIKEGFGMTLAEAGASGLPVIGNNHSSIKEIIQPGKTGFLARTDDVADWAAKLLQLIESPRLCRQMGQAGQKFVRTNFTWENNLKIHLRVYENLIS